MKSNKYKFKLGTYLAPSKESFGGYPISEFNEQFFGPEILEEPEVQKQEDDSTWVDLFPSTVSYVSVFKFTMNQADKKYAMLNGLPPALQDKLPANGFHGKLTLDYPFVLPYTTEFNFKTVNEVLEQIKDGFWKMYGATEVNGKQPYGEPLHIIEVLRVEFLKYNQETGEFLVGIGS